VIAAYQIHGLPKEEAEFFVNDLAKNTLSKFSQY